MQFDLHTHSNASDGVLTPIELWQSAVDAKLNYFAVTDHDTINGYQALVSELAARSHRIVASNDTQTQTASAPQLISGVEVSCSYLSHTIHVVGLNFDPNNAELKGLLADIQAMRAERAQAIANKLAFLELDNLLENVMTFNQCDIMGIARPHFARYLVHMGKVSSEQKAFKRWLVKGKRAFVATQWPDIERVVDAINQASGIAVLAHPTKYKMTRTKLRALVNVFAQAGGRAIELVYIRQTLNDTRYLQMLSKEFNLLASAGSDFHDPKMTWTAVGKVPPLPEGSDAIWKHFN